MLNPIRSIAALVLIFAHIAASGAGAEEPIQTKIDSTTAVLKELLGNPEYHFPESLLKSAAAIAVIPNVAVGEAVAGGRYGEGILVARSKSGGWSAPSFVTLSGGGPEARGTLNSPNVILIFNSPESVRKLSESGEIVLGKDVTTGPGPLETNLEIDPDTPFRVDVFSYRVWEDYETLVGRGLKDAVLRANSSANESLYGSEYGNLAAVLDRKEVPQKACTFLDVLAKHSGTGSVCG